MLEMELVYSIDFAAHEKHVIDSPFLDEKICCSLSCGNILAFSRASQSKAENDSSSITISYEVCVLDLDKPWQKYEVTTHKCPVTYMRWNPAGNILLMATSEGQFSLWRMEDSLINSWEEISSVSVDREEVLVLAWLHNGSQALFNPEVRDVVNYNEKFPRCKMKPSVTQFGKKPVDGWIAVTSTGLAHVGLMPSDFSKIITGSASLDILKTNVRHADVAFCTDGQILIATSDGQLNSSVKCYMVSIELSHHSCRVVSTPSASFFMKKQPESSLVEHPFSRLTRLSFLSRENSEVLLACWGTQDFSCIEVWHLIEQSVPLNRMFQNAMVSEQTVKTKRWMHKVSLPHRSGLTDIARPKLPISRTFNMDSTNFLSYFSSTYRDGSIKIVHRQSYQVIYTSSVDQLINMRNMTTPDRSEPPEKKLKTSSPHLVKAVQTNSGCGLVTIGDGRLYLFRVFNSRDGSLQLNPGYVVLLLEYSFYVGIDMWDILLAVRQGMIDGITEKLGSNFQKQTGAIQDMLQQRLLRLKMALFACLGAGNQRATDCRAFLTLQAISVLVKTCTRPKAVNGHDKSAMEKLTALCTSSMDTNLDNVIKTLDLEEFAIGSVVRTSKTKPALEVSLQSLQPVIQWVTDFVLHLLVAVSMYPNYTSYPGASLLKDVQALNLIRELLVIIRMWGKVRQSCSPIFVQIVSLDPLPHLYHLITKAWLAARDGTSIEMDQTFLDECCGLPSKMLIPSYKKTFGEEMNCFLAFSQQHAVHYQFGSDPDYLCSYVNRIYPLDLCLDGEQKYDCVRHINLGVRPVAPLRECVRCRSLSLRRSPDSTKSPLLRSWELRFVSRCPCGGYWRKHPGFSTPSSRVGPLVQQLKGS